MYIASKVQNRVIFRFRIQLLHRNFRSADHSDCSLTVHLMGSSSILSCLRLPKTTWGMGFELESWHCAFHCIIISSYVVVSRKRLLICGSEHHSQGPGLSSLMFSPAWHRCAPVTIFLLPIFMLPVDYRAWRRRTTSDRSELIDGKDILWVQLKWFVDDFWCFVLSR